MDFFFDFFFSKSFFFLIFRWMVVAVKNRSSDAGIGDSPLFHVVTKPVQLDLHRKDGPRLLNGAQDLRALGLERGAFCTIVPTAEQSALISSGDPAVCSAVRVGCFIDEDLLVSRTPLLETPVVGSGAEQVVGELFQKGLTAHFTRHWSKSGGHYQCLGTLLRPQAFPWLSSEWASSMSA